MSIEQINHRYGHAAGDAVLQEFVRRVNQLLGASDDWCARIGGAAYEIAEGIRVAVADGPVQTSVGTPARPTVATE